MLNFCKISFFLSFFFHSFIGLFVFTFSVPQEPFKPKFIFLGSILTEQDIKKNTVRKKKFPVDIPLNKWTYKTHSISKNPFFTPNVIKPYLIKKFSNIKQKEMIKSTFQINNKSPQDKMRKEKIIQKDVGVDINLQPYQKLRFHMQ